jgi:hypothetical protein
VDTDTADSIPGTNLHPSLETQDQDYASQDRAPQGAPFIEHFHMGTAGAPISDLCQSVPGYEALRNRLGQENIWYPFQSQHDWEWAKNQGPSSMAVSELLAFDGVSLSI